MSRSRGCKSLWEALAALLIGAISGALMHILPIIIFGFILLMTGYYVLVGVYRLLRRGCHLVVSFK